MNAVRDVLAEWLMYLIVAAGFGATVLATAWVIARVEQGRRDRDAPVRDIDTDVETIPLPRQREGSR